MVDHFPGGVSATTLHKRPKPCHPAVAAISLRTSSKAFTAATALRMSSSTFLLPRMHDLAALGNAPTDGGQEVPALLALRFDEESSPDARAVVLVQRWMADDPWTTPGLFRVARPAGRKWIQRLAMAMARPCATLEWSDLFSGAAALLPEHLQQNRHHKPALRHLYSWLCEHLGIPGHLDVSAARILAVFAIYLPPIARPQRRARHPLGRLCGKDCSRRPRQ